MRERSETSAVTVHIQPRASRTEIVGWHGDAIKIRIKAPPLEGAANRELQRFLARQLGVASSAVQLLSGASSRRKRVAVEGFTAEEVRRRLVSRAQ